ncbi:IQ domain-containing protein E isoform X4 [Tursiops truncatus]|uniref:IQ domain-containing protein E isoform X4 n=1 Tax=Tursiops truncatus TaxID=9739 RepID=A0A6J3Q2J0_TURTR|nr:IQ domain-containing protein E isoform X4 [Tursiops truncatus]
MAAGSRRARGQAPRLAVGGAPEPDGRTRSAQGRSGSAAAMSLSTGEPASEMGDDSLSAITFDSDSETKAKRKSFHRPPPTSPKSPYHSKPRKVASWRSLRTAGSAPLGSQMSLTPQKLWLGSSKQGYVPGTPVYREMEGMYDEIIELKKSLHVHKSNMDLMRTKLRRLEEENSRKDRQIEQLLDPSRGPDFVRTLAEKRPDTGWVISGLKQRILKLEQQCKEKNHTIDKLQTDMKTTNLEEMRIAMETYYEEIHRLQTLLASSETTGKKPPVEKNVGLKRQKRMSSALLSLSRSVQELTEENQSLKEDLDRVLSDSPTVSKIKGSVEWSKPRLLRRIAELEKKISLMESPKSHASEVVLSTPPAHSVSSSTVHRQPRPDRQEESERLRGVVKSLKGERNALHTRLQERDLEVKQLLQIKADLEKELENMKEGEKEGREREEALREEIQALTRKFQELEESKKGGEEDPEETSPETREAPRPPGPSQTDSELDTSEGGSSRPLSGCSEGRRDAAARLLQRRWKGHQHWKKQAVLDEDSPEPRVPSPVVQAEGDPWQEEAITIIQSAFRAHLARARHRTPWHDPCSGRRGCRQKPCCSNTFLSVAPCLPDPPGLGQDCPGCNGSEPLLLVHELPLQRFPTDLLGPHTVHPPLRPSLQPLLVIAFHFGFHARGSWPSEVSTKRAATVPEAGTCKVVSGGSSHGHLRAGYRLGHTFLSQLRPLSLGS